MILAKYQSPAGEDALLRVPLRYRLAARLTKYRYLAAGTAVCALVPLAFQLAELPSSAADHLDPPARTSPASDDTPDAPADIADVFAFHDDQNVVLILTFAGPQATDQPAVYDTDVLYRLNVSNAAPRTTTDMPIEIQFGQDIFTTGVPFGVRVRGLPGVTGDLIGPVESDIVTDGVRVRAGLFDDPFFFDLQGFRDTLSTGQLSFDNTRDFFARQNLTAVVIEIPRDRIENGASLIDVWSETARLGGQL
ncbi:DUF4331 family protein [uncultured Erythrobacter sp.]|uniref:DUF4331 family protein n=1 Tax=uncultured Erythrobacter sp. TaxID=263913 RepID=UPI00261528CB|nr:DUF4331 family protein [uncultured Erythrobacter sp.]